MMLVLLMLSACGSTKVNTAQSRFYQAFVTRFNVYHNGHEAYKEGQQFQLQAGGLQPAIRTGTIFMRFAPPRGIASLCSRHCSTCVAQIIRGMMI